MADLPRSYITINFKDPLPPPPERLMLTAYLRGHPIGIFYGTREKCEEKGQEFQRGYPDGGATYEIGPRPEPMELPRMTGEKADAAE